MFFVLGLFFAAFVLPDPWRIPAIGIGAALEVAETAISFRLTSRAKVRVGPETLVGSIGRVVEACRPHGEVRVNGELWRARCVAHADEGDRVRVVERHGLTLVVEHAEAPEPER